ncbi:tolloid-like protein 1 [Centruroides sculpturatus]|uniref:tolloid-like protein 1 n=1 Tax=Centruroides sculpturatus TaxID=218467 RepID=UPI000C6ECE65|nr:tolloid-like protein 1 [Centruroides sculpturatus]XP_023236138.1 tolloid-like protein 1 [Centruroides sculpturatus]
MGCIGRHALTAILFLSVLAKEAEESKIWRRVATADPNKLWEEGVLPYEIGENCSQGLRETIHRAMLEWESETCIKFVPAEPSHKYRLIIDNRGHCGCCSYVGRISERQITVFHETCNSVSTIMHELGHAIGFHHEQNRPDRDNYINVMFKNIKKGHKSNFRKMAESDVNTLGFAYDFNSIMHYSSKAFSLKGGETFRALNPSISLREKRVKLSRTDIAAANKLYKCPKCYVKLFKKMDEIALSNYSLASKEGYCQWFIERNPGEFIEFYVENVDILESENCSSNYLQFQDGYWSKSPIIDRVCGKREEKKLYTTKTNNLLITYKKSSANSATEQFSVKYRVICSGTIKADHGRIQSPQFDESYLYDSICQWVLTVPRGYRVALHFETFHIEGDENCFSDYVKVTDGQSSSGRKLVSRFCGNKAPSDTLSSNETLTVIFSSEERNVKSGFSATFIKEINECQLPDKGGCTGVCVNTVGSYYCQCEEGKLWFNRSRSCEKFVNTCGGELEVKEKMVVTSPSYPDLYPSNADCAWKILNENVRITFLHMDVDKSKNYCFDKLILWRRKKKKVYCGFDLPQPLEIREPGLRIRFTSNKKVERSGFALLLQPL